MDEKYLVDTSVWVEYFKSKDNIVEFIDRGLDNKNVFVTGVILTEILQGIKNDKEKQLVKFCMDAIPYYEVNKEDWIKTGELSNALRREGITLPLADVLIASIAIKNQCKILTYDKHFSLIDASLVASPE